MSAQRQAGSTCAAPLRGQAAAVLRGAASQPADRSAFALPLCNPASPRTRYSWYVPKLVPSAPVTGASRQGLSPGAPVVVLYGAPLRQGGRCACQDGTPLAFDALLPTSWAGQQHTQRRRPCNRTATVGRRVAAAAHQSDTRPPGQKARPNTKGSPCTGVGAAAVSAAWTGRAGGQQLRGTHPLDAGGRRQARIVGTRRARRPRGRVGHRRLRPGAAQAAGERQQRRQRSPRHVE